jgi:hypothetical protein
LSDPEHEVIDRRAVLLLLGGSVVAVACGAKSAAPASHAGTTGAATPTQPVSPGPSVAVGGPTVDPAHRFAADQVALARAHYAGTWLGSWIDDSGGSGTADAVIAVDTAARVLTVTTTFAGKLFGGAPPVSTTYRIAIDSFSKDADTLALDSPTLGHVVVDPIGFGLTCTGMPGHPEIDSMKISGTVTALAATCAYTVTMKDARQSKGAFSWSRGTTRPAAPQLGGATALQAFLQGDYAAGLVTSAELTAALGRPADPPSSNGGRQRYQPGIDVSNARAQSHDGSLIVQYGIYRGTDVPTAKAFYLLNAAVSTPVAGIGDAAQVITSGNHFLQVLRGREVLQISVLDTSNALPAAQLDTMARQVAADIVPGLDKF